MQALNRDEVERLKSLLMIVSPSMQESEMTAFLRKEWKSIYPDASVRIDSLGNLEVSMIKNPSLPTLALVAHADTVCIQITEGVGNGKYRFRSVGLSPQTLLGQKVIVLTENGQKYDGVIGFDATSQYGQPKGLVFEDLWIDVPQSKAWKYISPGDLAVVRPSVVISDQTVTSPGLDDRVGLFIIGEVLRRCSYSSMPVNLVLVATAQEEVGLRGSAMFHFSTIPDYVIVLDVDYATDIPTPHEDQMGRLWLHKGPGVQRKADCNSELRRLITECAKKNEVPLQVSLGRFLYGGTDATQMQTIRNDSGIKVCNLSIPCRYMHSPAETVSFDDLKNAIHLICYVAQNIGTETP